MKLEKIAVLFAGITAAASVFSANDGLLSATSQGDFDITFVNDTKARIWGLEDINLTETNGSDGTAATHEFCVFSNLADTGSNDYDLSVSSANAFQLVNSVSTGNDPGSSLAYDLVFTDPLSNQQTFNANAVNELSAGSLSGQPNPGNDDCASQGQNKTQIAVQFSGNEASLNAVAAGAYFDLITLTVTPK